MMSQEFNTLHTELKNIFESTIEKYKTKLSPTEIQQITHLKEHFFQHLNEVVVGKPHLPSKHIPGSNPANE
jgi:hypothetical protein